MSMSRVAAGLLAIGVGVVGVALYYVRRISVEVHFNTKYALSPDLNNARIIDHLVSQNIVGTRIVQFYAQHEGKSPGSVVCSTDENCVFLIHLTGFPNGLYTESILHTWNPEWRDIHTCNKSLEELAQHVTALGESFGCYALDRNDCRTFAKSVADFLVE